MTRIKLKDATMNLIQNSNTILKQASKARKSADTLAMAIDQLEKSFINAENQKLAHDRMLEQQKLVDSHITAYAMPDNIEKPTEQEDIKQKKQDDIVEDVKAEILKETPANSNVVRESNAIQKENNYIETEAKEKQVQAKPVKQEKPARPAEQKPYIPRQEYQQREQRPQIPRQYPNKRPDDNRNAQGTTGVRRQGFQDNRPYNNSPNYNRGYQATGVAGTSTASTQGQNRGFNKGPSFNRNNDNRTPYNKTDRPRPFVPSFNKDDEDDNNQNNKRRQAPRTTKPKSPDLIPIVEKEKVSNYDPNKKSYERRTTEYDSTARKKKVKVKDAYSFDDEYGYRGIKRGAKKKLSAQQLMDPIQIENAVMATESITVRDLCAKIGKQSNEILKKLFVLGIVANINSDLDYDTASIVASELGVELEQKLEKSAEDMLSDIHIEDDEESLVERPPVITIMGHVDHGKTSLLDFIRKSRVTSSEAGGITQHIGAYMVNVKGKPITFLDTPGHEAFTSMRARGAQATDIAVIVVAANDGVMPQTVEAINHAKAAGVQIIIAINKMDIETANPDRVKQDLTNYNLIPEEWGGDTIIVPLSALTGQGVDELLETILLVAEMQQYKANPNRMARGIIIEAKLDKARGPLATVLLKSGTLKVGDGIVAGTSSGHVRAMLNDDGTSVKSAGPSMPVEVSGFDEVPEAGDEMMVVDDSRLSKSIISNRKDKEKALKQSAGNKVTLENLFNQIEQGKLVKLNLIIKADVQGSVEAVAQAMEKLSNDEVKVTVLHSAVGAITNDDVNLASAFNSVIIGFNIRPNASAKEKAVKEGVDIRLYTVIYKAIEDMEKAMKGLLAPEFKEVVLGHAQVRDTFHISGTGTIAGCYVTDGKMQRKSSVRLLRDNVVVFEGKLSSLRRFKDDAKEVASNYECGISLDGYNDIKINDVIECFIEEEVER